MTRRIATTALLVAIAACDPDYPKVDSLDDCYVGAYFADCGPADVTVFGCGDDRLCRWYQGAVPRDLARVSTCDADRVCCEDDWPFESSDAPGGTGVTSLLYGLGTAPRDPRSRRPVGALAHGGSRAHGGRRAGARLRRDPAGSRCASFSYTMINPNQIKPDMPVVCSNDGQFATVDHIEGTSTIKLTKDKNGVHHYIPMSWVTSVDSKVHVDRPGDQAMREWSDKPLEMGPISARAPAPAKKPTP